MRLVKLKSLLPGARTADPEICRQLRPASSRLKLLLILRTTVQFFSARFACRFFFVPPFFLICTAAVVCLYCLSKNGSSTKITRIKSILQTYVQGAFSRFEASGPEGTMIWL